MDLFKHNKRLIAAGLILLLLCTAAARLWLFSDAATSQSKAKGQSTGTTVNRTNSETTSEPLPAISPQMAGSIRQLSKYEPEKFTETVNEDGSVTLHTNGHFQTVTVGVAAPDGSIIMRHGEEFLQNVKEK
jgi:hypothetical protein